MTTVLDIHNLETPPEIVEVIVQESRLDASAIHKTTASEISEIEEKTTLSENDYFLIEDSEDSNNKKSSTISALTTFSSGEVNTISNIGTSGIGIYKQKDGVNFELKKINPLSSKITVVDNTTDNEINLDIAENEINHNNITNVGTLTHSEIDNYINNEALIKSVYDPNNINADIFNLDNIVEGITNKILTTSERSKISNLPDDTQSALNAINSILSSDDTSLDELQEIVNYIKTNKSTLDALSFDDIAETLTYKYYTLTEKNKLSGIEENATGDQTGAEIKSLYESESDTNAFTDAEKTKLAGLTGGSGGYISEEDSTNLTDNGETTLHYHASDRDRANHTGTQTASTISDFDAEVSNNSDVSSNTTYRNIGHIPNSEKGSNNGVATLDSGGKVPSTQLPITIMNYLGTWNANTNDPNLLDGTGSAGDVYKISVSGSKDLGSGSIDFDIGDWIIYNGSIWEKNDNTDAVTSVNSQTGIVSLDSDDISEGSTNLYLSGNEFQKNVDTMDNITNGSTYVKTTNDYTNTEKTKLSNIEENATADLTSSEIKSLYESESNTNAYTDADKTKVDNTSGINTGDQDTSTIIHEKIGTPTYKTLKDWFDAVQSAGVISGGTITDNGDGTVAVSAGTGIIKSTNSDVGENLFFDFAASSSVSVDDNALSYIVIDYNLGTPQITTSTTKTANGHTIFNLGKCYREGAVIDILNSGHRIQDLSKRIQQHHVEMDDIQLVSGVIVSETGTRNITITAGVLYAGLNRITTDSIDTSGSNTFEHYYYNGSAWVKSSQTQIDNTQYNDIASGLSTLSNNQYGVHWVYKGTNGGAYVIYGQDSYTLAEAQSADIPSSLPDHVDNFGALRAKIIIAKNATAFTEVQNIKTANFQAISASDHNELTGLQGGTSNEYYHLTNTQYTDLTDGGITTLHTHASSGGISDIIEDTSPQLGGDLDLNDFTIMQNGIPVLLASTVYGVRYDKINDTITAGVVINGQFVESEYTTFPIQEQCGRGLLTTSGVWTKLDPTDSTKLETGETATLDGSAGQVMVRIPKFYQVIKESGNYQYYFISFTLFIFDSTPAWIPPAFGDDEYRYIGAFNGVAATDALDADVVSAVIDTSAYVTNTTPNPFTDRTRGQFRAQQQSGFFQYSWGCYELVRILFLTKYKTWDSQTVLPGFTDGGAWDYSKVTEAGSTLSLGDSDGSIYDDTNGWYKANSFLRIENFYGNVWEWLDGINIDNTTGDCIVYVCNTPANFADDTASNYVTTGHAPAFADEYGYQKYILGSGKYCPFYPADLNDGADSTSYQTDYNYNSAGSWRVLLCGGSLSFGDQAGLAFLRVHGASSFVASSFSVRSAA